MAAWAQEGSSWQLRPRARALPSGMSRRPSLLAVSPGYAFVNFYRPTHAAQAMAMCRDKPLSGLPLGVPWCVARRALWCHSEGHSRFHLLKERCQFGWATPAVTSVGHVWQLAPVINSVAPPTKAVHPKTHRSKPSRFWPTPRNICQGSTKSGLASTKSARDRQIWARFDQCRALLDLTFADIGNKSRRVSTRFEPHRPMLVWLPPELGDVDPISVGPDFGDSSDVAFLGRRSSASRFFRPNVCLLAPSFSNFVPPRGRPQRSTS